MPLGIVIGGGVAATAPLLLHIVFGQHFVAGAPYLRIFGLAIAIYYASNWCSNVLIAAGAIHTVVWVQGVLALVNLGGNVLLIPHFGARGSAWMTVACEALGMVIYAARLRSLRFLRPEPRSSTANREEP
jgi:O-antigen/teichoic acid export membrane protein